MTVMTTTFIPTRSGDGTFILEFVLSQYTLLSPFSGQIRRYFDSSANFCTYMDLP